MTYQTRSARHIKVQNRKYLSSKNVLPMIGAGLIVAPTVLIVAPQANAAEEIELDETNAYYLINQIAWSAQEIAASNDLYASVMIAQALLESANGTSLLSSAPYYNLFGVKGYEDPTAVWLATQEYVEGQWVTMNEPFRTYGSYWDSIQDQAALLRSSNYINGVPYYAGVWKSQTTSFYDATAYLTGRYATDPGYNQKLNWLIEYYNLTQYDTPTQYVENTAYSTETATVDENYVTSGSYIVVAGDTLWDIAQINGISLDQLMQNNGLSDELIVIGQELLI